MTVRPQSSQRRHGLDGSQVTCVFSWHRSNLALLESSRKRGHDRLGVMSRIVVTRWKSSIHWQAPEFEVECCWKAFEALTFGIELTAPDRDARSRTATTQGLSSISRMSSIGSFALALFCNKLVVGSSTMSKNSCHFWALESLTNCYTNFFKTRLSQEILKPILSSKEDAYGNKVVRFRLTL